MIKLFLNTVAIGAALAAGIISVFQNVPFFIFVKRVAASFAVFYVAGLAFDILWRATSTYMGVAHTGGKHSESKESADEGVQGRV